MIIKARTIGEGRRSPQAPWRIYMAPIVVGVLLFFMFVVWNVSRWTELQEDQRTHLVRIGERFAVFLDVTLHQHDDAFRHPEKIRVGFQELTSLGGFIQSVAVVVDGELIVTVGEPIPEVTRGVPGQWDRADGSLVVARHIRRSREEPLTLFETLPFMSSPKEKKLEASSAPLLFMSLNPSTLPFWHPRFKGMVTEALLVFLTLMAMFVVWSMGIRNRHFVARLMLEQSRSDHLRELNIAAAGLAHETKNPLGLIRGLAQRLHASKLEDHGQVHHQLEQIIDAADRATERLGEFLNFARLRGPELKEVSLQDTISTLTEVLRYDFEAAGIDLEVDPVEVTILCDDAMFQQVLLNLLLNSLEASEPGGLVKILLHLSKDKTLTLEVQDHGCGVAEELREHIFEPYVTGSADGNGLGLAIVRRIAEEHGWGLELEGEEGVGTTLRLTNIQCRGEV